MIPELLYLIPEGITNTHTHTTHDALRRKDKLLLAGIIERPYFVPDHNAQKIAQRTYLRVPLAQCARVRSDGQLMQLKVWLVQLSHIKVGKKGGPSFLGKNTLHKKIQLFSAALNQGRRKAAAASTRGIPFIPVTLGDQNLTKDEVLNNRPFRSLVKHTFFVAASEGVVDKQNRMHQDLIMVDHGVTFAPSRCDVFGFDGGGSPC